MRLLLPFTTFAISVCLLCGCKKHFSKEPLDQRLKDATSVIFCEESSVISSRKSMEMRPLSDVISDPLIVKKWAKHLCVAQPVSEYPGIGHLARLIFLNHNNDPIALVSIVNYKCTINIRECHKRSGKYWVDLTPETFRLDQTCRSEPFVQDVYDYMKSHMSGKLLTLEIFYNTQGDNLESMLFDGIGSSNEAGAPKGIQAPALDN